MSARSIHSRLTGFAAAALLLSFAPTSALSQDDTFEWEGRLAAGATLHVQNIVGNVHAVLASGNRAEVVATKMGRRSDFGEVDIEVAETDDGIKICVSYGSWNHGGAPCEHDDRDRPDNRRDDDIDVSVEFEVRVPAGVDFRGGTVTGDVEATGLRSQVAASSVTGDVTVSSTELVSANTVTGSLDVELGNADWDDLDFHTVTGDITLRLPAGLDANFEFQSISGDFESDFEVEIENQRRRLVGTRVRGTIGDGGRTLSLKTVSGDVRLRRAG